jgi:hypothetical protein
MVRPSWQAQILSVEDTHNGPFKTPLKRFDTMVSARQAPHQGKQVLRRHCAEENCREQAE